MVGPHAEDRFYEPDWYFGKQSTDITKRFGKEIPTHAYNPQIRNAATPYHVIPYHDMSEKFRNKLRWDRRSAATPEDTYHGRRATEITSPTKFIQEENEVPFVPWPESSSRIGTMNFSRFEYFHPLGKTRPTPMDDYVPILRHKRSGKVIGNPSPPPSRKDSRRRLLGLPPDGCHNPASPCRSSSPVQHEEGSGEEDEDEAEADLKEAEQNQRDHHSQARPRPDDQQDQATSPTPNVGRHRPPTQPRPFSAPAPIEALESQKPRRRKSYLSSTFGNQTSHMQPVGGRHQRNHEHEMEGRMYDNDQDESRYSYIAGQPELSRVKYSLGSMSHHAQPVGGRASIINRLDMEGNRRAFSPSEYLEAPTSDYPPAHTPPNVVYTPQHHSFSQEPSQRNRNDEAFTQHKFKSTRDDQSTTSTQSERKISTPPEYNPNLPPESERGRSHRREREREEMRR